MRKNLLVAQHLTISATIFFVMLAAIMGLFFLAKGVIQEPVKYFSTTMSGTDLQILIIEILLITSCVLISFILYLVLTLNTRAEIMVLQETGSLHASLEQFRKLYEGAPVPYLTLNQKGEISAANKAALRFFEVVIEEIAGQNIFYFEPQEDTEKEEKLIQYYDSNIPINNKEVRMVTKSGLIKWVLLTVFKMVNHENGEQTGLATIFDITEQKQLDKSKTEFVSLASHQLRTPVATVKWYVDMLLTGNAGELSPKQKEYMSTIFTVNENMIDLIETLLNVSRVEIGSITIDIKPTNVTELIESVLTELSPLIEKKGLIIDKKYESNLENIKSDPKLLRIVIQNLISNSVKYTLDGGTIVINLQEHSGEKSIVVSDNGVGIPKSQQDKIFTKLFRADNVRKLVDSQGTGLGLYLIKSIVEALGGHLSFVSEENKGSVFSVKF